MRVRVAAERSAAFLCDQLCWLCTLSGGLTCASCVNLLTTPVLKKLQSRRQISIQTDRHMYRLFVAQRSAAFGCKMGYISRLSMYRLCWPCMHSGRLTCHSCVVLLKFAYHAPPEKVAVAASSFYSDGQTDIQVVIGCVGCARLLLVVIGCVGCAHIPED